MTQDETIFLRLLKSIQEHDNLPFPEYEARNTSVYGALWMARRLKIPCGIRIDLAEPEWPVAFLELPTGQISYHLPQHVIPWDGDKTDKDKRINEYMSQMGG